MADTLPNTVAPDTGLERKITPNVKVQKFGDGYSQRTTMGINQKPIKTSFTWSYLNETQKDVYDAFAIAHSNGEAWLYQFPDEDAPRAFYITDWSVKIVMHGIYIVTYSVEEVFDIL